MTNVIGVLFVVAFAAYAISRIKSQPAEDDEWENPFAGQGDDRQVKRKAYLFYLFMIVAVIIYFASSYLAQYMG